MVQATWFERDLPVLRAIVELDEEPDRFWVSDQDIVERTGLDPDTVQQALRALRYEDPPLAEFAVTKATGRIDMIKGITGHARRAVAQWPDPKTDAQEQIAAIVAAFEQAVDKAPDEESKSKLRALASSFKGLPAQVAEGVSTALLLKLTGLG